MICVILPIYNEHELLDTAINSVTNILQREKYKFKLILAEDASTDGSYEICQKYSEMNPNIVHLHSDVKKGRGDALKRSIRFVDENFRSTCKVIGYLDVDLSTPPEFIPVAISKILDEGYDIVIGSRRHKLSKSQRSVKRRFFSWGYNTLINILFRTGLSDHQCGFKFFKFNATKDILVNALDDKWFWDTEVLIRAKQKGLRIYEMPVQWVESPRDSKVSIWRDTKEMLISALKFKFFHGREYV